MKNKYSLIKQTIHFKIDYFVMNQIFSQLK